MYVFTNLLTTSQTDDSVYNLALYQDCALIRVLVNGLRINDANIVIEVLQATKVIMELDKKCDLKG